MESPDLTTNGVLKKRWIKKDGETYLIKGGCERYHQSPIYEVLASMTMEQLGIVPFVRYELCIEGLSICSICRNFITEDKEYVPVSHIYNKVKRQAPEESVYEHLMTMCRKYNVPGARKYIDRMIAIDHYICNPDRHLNNFGLIRDVETGRIDGFAPIFDCGSAYFKKEDSKMFLEKEDDCINKISGLLNGKTVDERPLIDLLNAYPDMDDTDRQYAIKSITNSFAELSRMIERAGKNKNNTMMYEEEISY